MTIRFGLVTSILVLSFVSGFSDSRAAADPTWDLVETSCSDINSGGGDCSLTFPITIGEVTGSGTYLDEPNAFSESGNFSADIGGFDFTSNNTSSRCGSGNFVLYNCAIDISLIDTASGLSGYLNYFSAEYGAVIDLTFGGIGFDGRYGSEDTLLKGCGDIFNDVGCFVSGDLVSTPEPSSLPMLLAGLGLIGGAFYFWRKKATTRT